MMTSPEAESTIATRGNAVTRGTTLEAGARSETQAEALLANEATGATARTIGNFRKRRNSQILRTSGCPATART